MLYDLTANRIWTANARANGGDGPRNAYDRAFVELDLRAVSQRARELSRQSSGWNSWDTPLELPPVAVPGHPIPLMTNPHSHTP